MYDVLVVFCQDSVTIFADAKKINYLKQVKRVESMNLSLNRLNLD